MAPHKSNKFPTDKPNKPSEEKTPAQRFEDDEHLLGTRVLPEDVSLPSPDNVNELHYQIETLTKSLKEAQEKADSHWERLLRKEAEFQNLQRRMQQDVDNTRKFAIERFAAEILEVLDSLERGLNFSQNNQATVKDLMEGMGLTHSVLLNALDKQGIKPIDPAEGEAFDPTYHEAIAMHDTNDIPPNRVVKVVQKGYMLQNRLLRPARVVVSRAATNNV